MVLNSCHAEKHRSNLAVQSQENLEFNQLAEKYSVYTYELNCLCRAKKVFRCLEGRHCDQSFASNAPDQRSKSVRERLPISVIQAFDRSPLLVSHVAHSCCPLPSAAAPALLNSLPAHEWTRPAILYSGGKRKPDDIQSTFRHSSI